MTSRLVDPSKSHKPTPNVARKHNAEMKRSVTRPRPKTCSACGADLIDGACWLCETEGE